MKSIKRDFNTVKRLLNIKEAAGYLATTPGSLYQKVHNGTIPYVKIGRSVRFDVNDLDKLINDNKVDVISYEFSGIRKRIEKNNSVHQI
jgi:excisionase family DNA binding protein